ncbi:hypothetical protein J6590_039644 [Homalodisca vitripennis]|nr:hypothetical protein J6590_039644 [Homalodisca vitripennis]
MARGEEGCVNHSFLKTSRPRHGGGLQGQAGRAWLTCDSSFPPANLPSKQYNTSVTSVVIESASLNFSINIMYIPTLMKKEADERTLSIPLAKARVRTAVATGVSEREISRIKKELKNLTVNNDNGESSFLTPNKLKRNRKKPITGLDDFDKALIRRSQSQSRAPRLIISSVSTNTLTSKKHHSLQRV